MEFNKKPKKQQQRMNIFVSPTNPSNTNLSKKHPQIPQSNKPYKPQMTLNLID
jgi:hypothetical protein